jgi:DNA-binding SARP family transcriptional activator/tetratricopeptide (TPR) repeat protein
MEFRILGPLEAISDGQPVDLGGLRQKTLLAMLLLGEGTVVPVSRLCEAMWEKEPPRTARNQVQICVTSIRHTMAAAGVQSLIDTQHPGYILQLRDATLDSCEFEAAVATARSLTCDHERAAAAYREALSMWHGAPFSGIESQLVRHAVVQLEELHMAAIEECMEVELEVRPYPELIGELVTLVHEHPLREHLRALLMIALYRSGRQAEALEVYRATRAAMIDQLGIEPGPELQKLHVAMLNGELADRPDSARAAILAPRLLPPALPDFIDRDRLTDRILSAADPAQSRSAPRALPVNIVFGRSGAGKTALAVEAAHRLAGSFPDGQLFVRLSSGGRPVSAAEVLARFLRVLGVDAMSIPDGLEQRAEMYRNLLGNRRVLIVLDDAMSEKQVSHLLPGNSQCFVLITSRRRFTGIPALNRYELRAMSTETAIALLTRILGRDRICAEPEAARQLCGLCGNLPLALRAAAARLAARPYWNIADQVERLLDESRRLDELTHGETGMRASLVLTYDTLSSDAQRLFRLMSVLGFPSFASWMAATLLRSDVPHAEDILEELAEAYLVKTERTSAREPVRYFYDDIAGSFALERLTDEESPGEQRSALERVIAALLFVAREAHNREYSGDYLLPPTDTGRWRLPQSLVDRLLYDPLTWYEEERQSLSAAVRQAAVTGLAGYAWSLAISSVALYEARRYFSDWRETHEAALKAAWQAEDKRGEAAMRYSLGSLFMFQQQNGHARRQFRFASEIYHELGESYGAALVARNMAVLDRRDGDLRKAIERWEQALRVFVVTGDMIAVAHVLYNLAQAQLDCGNDGAASELLARADEICQRTQSHRVGAQVQKKIGDVCLKTGDLDTAAQTYANVVLTARLSGDRVGECYGALGMSMVALRRGRVEAAEQTITEAVRQADLTGDPVIRSRLRMAWAEVDLGLGREDVAAVHSDASVNLAEEAGANLLIAETLSNRATVHEAAEQVERAKTVLEKALRKLDDGGTGPLPALAKEITQRLDELDRRNDT